jgi:methylmalonyl-CoA mutase N-terminal domain/subunit
MQLRFHTQTAGVSLTAQQPEVNIARVAIQALSGVLGGTQSLHTDSYDEALALPTDKAARIALRTQQVIAHETGAALVADPLGGSHYVEWMTDEMERQAEEIFAHLDEIGGGSILEGVLAGIEDGWFQGEIADAAYAFEKKVVGGRRIVVGVNAFTEGDADRPPILSIGAEAEDRQRVRLAEVKAGRDQAAVDAALARVGADAEVADRNLMPAIIDAVQTYATEGEIIETLAGSFGRWAETPVI